MQELNDWLLKAAAAGDSEDIGFLLRLGADPNTRDREVMGAVCIDTIYESIYRSAWVIWVSES